MFCLLGITITSKALNILRVSWHIPFYIYPPAFHSIFYAVLSCDAKCCLPLSLDNLHILALSAHKFVHRCTANDMCLQKSYFSMICPCSCHDPYPPWNSSELCYYSLVFTWIPPFIDQVTKIWKYGSWLWAFQASILVYFNLDTYLITNKSPWSSIFETFHIFLIKFYQDCVVRKQYDTPFPYSLL